MSESQPRTGAGKDRPRLRRFQDLMHWRVRHVLLVASLYDSFILVEDGQLNEAILREYLELNISDNPDLTRVSTGADAFNLARKNRFDLIISTMQVGEMNALELAESLRREGVDAPVILLGYENQELDDFLSHNDTSALEAAFLWQGDVRILLAMVKAVEDRRNIEIDTGKYGVPAILVVEDNVRFYSSFLPAIYAATLQHTHRLLPEGRNLSHKMLRSRARPRVLLARTFEEAWDLVERYQEPLLGIISDIEFPHDGKLDKQAGVELARRAREIRDDLPIVLQSSIAANEQLAFELGASFLLKGSRLLLEQLREILRDQFGFGDFRFRLRDGELVAVAQDLKSLVEAIRNVPGESLVYHGERQHFSSWLKARTEFELADRLRPQRVAQFKDNEDLRAYLVQMIDGYRTERARAVVADFDSERFDGTSSITRIGGGSLGGKARGLAFINRLLAEAEMSKRQSNVRVIVPESVVLGTDVFDAFVDSHDLRRFAIESESDTSTLERFLGLPLADSVVNDLRVFLAHFRGPLAVRSSGLLEDSANRPFAGVYQTFMLPNNHPDLEVRLWQLIAAVKHVWVSTYSRQAKDFMLVSPYRLEEERMAVIIQRIVGAEHERRFYPEISGVARSHNFYPSGRLKASDGIVAAALGLGRTVVEGGRCVMFSPKHPKLTVGLGTVDEWLQNSQRDFYALDLDREPVARGSEGQELTSYGLAVAERDGTLARVGSTYSPDNDRLYDGVGRPGVRVVSLAPLLKHDDFPLAETIETLLQVGERGIGGPVEIEFAVNLSVPEGETPEFGFLQLRPLVLKSEGAELTIGHVPTGDLVCRSSSVLGHGLVDDLLDLLVVPSSRFDRMKSREVADEVTQLAGILRQQGVPFVLIGVGRWGSADPHLGIPVSWGQIQGARVIIESGFEDFAVEPSQGSHFFQNLTSCNVGYFTVNPQQRGGGFLDWDWLCEHPAVSESQFVRHIRVDEPIVVKMDGRRGEGVILKPGAKG